MTTEKDRTGNESQIGTQVGENDNSIDETSEDSYSNKDDCVSCDSATYNNSTKNVDENIVAKSVSDTELCEQQGEDINHISDVDTVPFGGQTAQPGIDISRDTKKVEVVTITNPMCGENYSFSINKYLGTYDILSVQYSDKEGDLTIQYIGDDVLISGVPSKSRDWCAEVLLPDKIIRFACFVNANPRQIWKDIPSDQIVKPDKYYRAILTPTLDIIGASHRGRSHANKGTYRDDDFYLNMVENITISVVADGAGSAEFSSTGSKIFSKTVGEQMSKLLVEKKSKLMEILRDIQGHPQNQFFRPDFAACLYEILPAAALYGRNQLIEISKQKNLPINKFHTTALLSFTMPLDTSNYFCAAFQIGDGITVVLHEDKVDILGKADTGTAPGETVFVTSNGVFDNATDLMKRIHICFTTSKPIIISMTDGITDSYFKESMKVDDVNLWKHFVSEIQNNDGLFKSAPEICDWLNYYVAQEHDDRTVTIVHYK